MTLLRPVVVAVLALDAVLLALTELAWLTARLGTVAFPVSALVAAVTTPLLVVAADRLRPGARAAVAPLVAWTLTVLVVGMWSPAGGGVLPADGRAVLLFAAGIVPGTLAAVLRPARPVRPRPA